MNEQKILKTWVSKLRTFNGKPLKRGLQTKKGYSALGLLVESFGPIARRDKKTGLLTRKQPGEIIEGIVNILNGDKLMLAIVSHKMFFEYLTEIGYIDDKDRHVYDPLTFDELADIIQIVYFSK